MVRVCAILGVIVIHATPFESATLPIGRSLDLATVLNQIARFAVPFFFVVSGFFWSRKVAETGQVRGPTVALARRALLLWLGWSLIYLLPLNLYDALARGASGPLKVLWWNLVAVREHPLIALLEGTSPHLWFLVALIGCAVISAACEFFRARWALVILALVLYAVGLAGQAYPRAPFGFALDPAFRNGHLFALAFFATGAWLQRRGVQGTWLPVGIALAAAGLGLHLLEVELNHRLWGMPLERDYVAGTYLLGVGAALIALSGTRAFHWERVAAVGPWVLGIYASHMVFVALLKPLERQFAGVLGWELVHVPIVFLLAYVTARMLARFRLTRPLVT